MTLQDRARELSDNLVEWAQRDSRSIHEQRNHIAAALVSFAREHAERAVRKALRERPQMRSVHTPPQQYVGLNAPIMGRIELVHYDDDASVQSALAAAEEGDK